MGKRKHLFHAIGEDLQNIRIAQKAAKGRQVLALATKRLRQHLEILEDLGYDVWIVMTRYLSNEKRKVWEISCKPAPDSTHAVMIEVYLSENGGSVRKGPVFAKAICLGRPVLEVRTEVKPSGCISLDETEELCRSLGISITA